MDDKRRARREALRRLARQDKRNIKEEGFAPVKVMEDKDEYFDNLRERRKARAEKVMDRQESGAHIKESFDSLNKNRELMAEIDERNKKREAAAKKERLKNYKKFLDREQK